MKENKFNLFLARLKSHLGVAALAVALAVARAVAPALRLNFSEPQLFHSLAFIHTDWSYGG